MRKSIKGHHSKHLDLLKPVLYQGKLNIQKKNKKFEPRLFKLLDKKLVFYHVVKHKKINQFK